MRKRMKNLANKVIIVAGATGGIGSATASSPRRLWCYRHRCVTAKPGLGITSPGNKRHQAQERHI